MKRYNIILGSILILGAISVIINKLGFFPGINVFNIVIALLLVLVIIKSIRKLEFGGIIFPLAFIGIIFDDELGITSLTPWTLLLAATLATIGLSLIFKRNSLDGLYIFHDER